MSGPIVVPDKVFEILVAAAIAGGPCPKNHPHGPLCPYAVKTLMRERRIRSDLIGRAFRQITILVGPHAGKQTQAHPGDKLPWRISGKPKSERHPRREQSSST